VRERRKRMIGKGITYASIVDLKIYSSFSKELTNAGTDAQQFEFVILTEEKSCFILFRCQYDRRKDNPKVIEVLDVYSIYNRDEALDAATRL
jgi:hypothetical protein